MVRVPVADIAAINFALFKGSPAAVLKICCYVLRKVPGARKVDKCRYKRYSGPAVRCYSGLQGFEAHKTRFDYPSAQAGGVVLGRQTVSGVLLPGGMEEHWRASTGGTCIAAQRGVLLQTA